jgi:hypothetical protein
MNKIYVLCSLKRLSVESGVFNVNTGSFVCSFLYPYATITVQVLRSTTQDRISLWKGRARLHRGLAGTSGEKITRVPSLLGFSVTSLFVSDSEAIFFGI